MKMWEGRKSFTSLIFAIVMLVLGIVPLLNYFNLISWNINFMLTPLGAFLTYVLAAGALFLIIDSFMEGLDEPQGRLAFFVGILLLIIGLLPVIGIMIPFVSGILTPMVYYFLFTIEGIFLLIDSFLM
jgi:hypothetical protein